MNKFFTSGVFYARHGRDFNFELNEKQLIKEALQRGFIEKVYSTKGTKYTYNPDYKSVTAEDVNEVIRDNGTDASEMVQDLVDEELYGEQALWD